MWYIQTMEYHFTVKKEWRTDIRFNIDGPWKYAKWKKPDKKATYYMISIRWNVQNRQIHTDRKKNSGCQGLGWEENGEWLLIGTGFLFGVVIKMF